jgi:hypothetical protein
MAGVQPAQPASLNSSKSNTVDNVRWNIDNRAWSADSFYGANYRYDTDPDWYHREVFASKFGMVTPYPADALTKFGNPFDAWRYTVDVADVQYELLKAVNARDGFSVGEVRRRDPADLAREMLSAMQGNNGSWQYSGLYPGAAVAAIMNNDRTYDFSKAPQLSAPTVTVTNPVTGEQVDYYDETYQAEETARQAPTVTAGAGFDSASTSTDRSPTEACSTCSPLIGAGFDPRADQNPLNPDGGTSTKTVASLPASAPEGTRLIQGGYTYVMRGGSWTLADIGSEMQLVTPGGTPRLFPTTQNAGAAALDPSISVSIGWQIWALLLFALLLGLWTGAIEL